MTEATTPTPPTLDSYLREHVTPRFTELVRGAEQRAAAAQRELDDLRAAAGTIAWEIDGAPPAVKYINIADGGMTISDQPASPPFMTMAQTVEDWARFTGELAQSGMLGGGNQRPFGRSRIDRLRGISGALRFVLTGLAGGAKWTCTLYLGSGARPAEPQTTITLALDTVNKIQSGQLQPQAAFMQGQVQLSGDMGLAMQLGMALFM